MTTHSHIFAAMIARELDLSDKSVLSVISLLEEGNTIPFIARYRKEVTQNLDEVYIRTIQERLTYLKEMEDRRQTILSTIESQGKLTDELRTQINTCTTKNELEDLYLPYKPKRRTRAAIAREKGLEPLATLFLEQPISGNPEEESLKYVNEEKGVNSAEEALSGASDIAAEIISENAAIRALVREAFARDGVVCSKVIEGKQHEPTKYEQYYDFQETVAKIPSHRYLAIRRGANEGILEFSIIVESEPLISSIATLLKLNSRSPFSSLLKKALEDSYKRLILPSVETDTRVDLKIKSDREAVDVFAQNLRNLLLAPPLGGFRVIGIDPGLRTGSKCAAVDETGKYLDTITVYLSQGEHSLNQARVQLLEFIKKFKPLAIGIGNGTGGRETEAFVKHLISSAALDIIITPVSESGASVYSASDIARDEFPNLDLTIRGAISIARRLQDPLAELVKVDPKSIGVGQYQHDVYQPLLQDKLNEVVESCVNHVGVEINTASAPLLTQVAGIGASLAQKIVTYRNEHGAFLSRKQLLKVPGLGAKTFEQAAGFLRIRGGEHPLDSSAVHPERYELVETIARDLGTTVGSLIGNNALIGSIDIKRYLSLGAGEHTLKDIVAELKKPGRDPRASFERPQFRDDINTIKDLKPDMQLEGVVTNVAAFGAFVDIGVHQDGFIHVSELADKFVKDPSEVVQVGMRLKVKVLNVDVERNRISLSAKRGQGQPRQETPRKDIGRSHTQPKSQPAKNKFSHNPFSSL